jgi:hypothetical protein
MKKPPKQQFALVVCAPFTTTTVEFSSQIFGTQIFPLAYILCLNWWSKRQQQLTRILISKARMKVKMGSEGRW